MRGKGEVGDTDDIAVRNAALVSLEGSDRALEQPGIYRATDPCRSSDSGPRSGGPSGQASNSYSEKNATGNLKSSAGNLL
jgi:hypothetical protein